MSHCARLQPAKPRFSYQGKVGAYLVLGGVDATGAHLFTVQAHGSTDKLPYVTLGSGSLAAMAVFESSFKENLKVSGGAPDQPDFASDFVFEVGQLTTHSGKMRSP